MPRPLRFHHVTPALEHLIALRDMLLAATPQTIQAESLAVAVRLAQQSIRQRTDRLAAALARRNAILFQLHPKPKKGPSQPP